jgi:MFS family permease
VSDDAEASRTRMLAVASVSLLLSVLVWFNYSAVLPLVVADWGLSGTRAGVVFGAFQAGYLLSVVPAGALADRRSPRVVVAGGAALAGGASLAFALVADGFVAGTALRALSGVGMAGVYVPGMRFVAAWYPESVRGRAMGVYVGTYSTSAGLSFLLASAVASTVGWRTAVAATSVGALLVPGVVLGLGRDPPGAADADGAGLDLSVLHNRAYLAAVAVYAFHNWELFGVRNWILAFLVATTTLGASAAGTVVGVVVALGGAGNLLGGALSDRLGRRRVVGGALAVSGVVSAGLGHLGVVGLSLPLLLVVVAVYGVALTADSAPTSTTVTELVADERMGTALSLQSLVGFSTTVVSPVVFGLALDRAGYGLAFPTLAAGALAALVALAALGRLAPRAGPTAG